MESTIDSYGEVIDRFGLRLAAESPYLFTHQRLVMLLIRLWNSDLDLGLVWRTGQAGICVLNPGERSTVSHRRRCAEPERAEENVRTRCLEATGVLRRHFLPRGTFEREFESVRIRLFVTSGIRAFWTLSSRP